MILQLVGPVPCKKSKYRRGRTALYLDRSVSAAIDALVLQAQAQWRRPPVEHPDITITFRVRHRRADRDGMLATVMDILQRAGVVANDNIARCNGWVHLAPAVIGDDEGVNIKISGFKDLRDRGRLA